MNGTSHESVITHAEEILESDGHHTYAYLAKMFESQLLRGCGYADSAGEDLYIDIKLRSVVSFGCTIKTWREKVCNMSSLTHYHDPITNQGLDLSQYSSLEAWAEAGAAAGAILLGAAGFWVDVDAVPPINFNQPYQSAADACQEHYNLAVSTWRGLSTGDGDPWGKAMFHLGWACHFIGDICISPHTVSNEFWTHDNYENAFNQYLSDPNIHAHNISQNLAQYGLNVSVRDLVHQAAVETRNELPFYQNNQWQQGIQRAVPRAEVYIARLLAKFFQEVGVSQYPNPLTARVGEIDETLIPYAALFYRKDNQAWTPLVTNDRGTVMLPFKVGDVVQFRPAVPGYLFEGHYFGYASTIPEFPAPQSPVVYTHAANPTIQPTIQFRMRKVVPDLRITPEALDMLRALVRENQLIVKIDGRILPQTHDERVAEVIQDLVDVQLTGGVAGPGPCLQVGSPVPVHLNVRVYRPINISQAQFARTKADMANLVRLSDDPQAHEWHVARQLREGIRRGAERQRIVPAPEVLEAISHMPVNTDSQGAPIHTGQVTRRDLGILANAPIILVAAPGHHRVTVDVLQEPGFVGYCCPGQTTLTVTTNLWESASINILPGNQAGRLRLRISVCDADNASNDLDAVTKMVELWVLPSINGGTDSTPFIPPVLQPNGA